MRVAFSLLFGRLARTARVYHKQRRPLLLGAEVPAPIADPHFRFARHAGALAALSLP
jgi:hypothetical protein